MLCNRIQKFGSDGTGDWMQRPTKITFGELRASGVRQVLLYCRDHKCTHQVTVNADRCPLMSGCRTSSQASSAAPAASAARPAFAHARMGAD